MKSAAGAIVFATFLGLCQAAPGQGEIAKEMLERQLRAIKTTEAATPVVLRLDLEIEELLKRARALPAADQVAFVAGGMQSQRSLYTHFGMSDLKGFSAILLGQVRNDRVQLHRDAFAGRDLTREIHAAYQRCVKACGKPLPHAPIYKVAYGYQRATNARTVGIDTVSKRPIVILNRSALTPGRLWDSAIIHEFCPRS